MNYEAWRFWIMVAQIAANIVVITYVWWTNREKVNHKRFQGLEKEVAERVTQADLEKAVAKLNAPCQGHIQRTCELERRATELTADLNHRPSHADMAKLSARMDEVHGDLHEIAGGVKGLQRAVDLMNEYLINNGGKR